MDLFSDPGRFMNRELSWLEFNRRVLDESCAHSNPLLERLRFLSISVNNLDEFFMVRVAGLVAQQRQGIEAKSADGLTAAEQLTAIGDSVDRLQQKQQKCFGTLIEKLADQQIRIVKPETASPDQQEWLRGHFTDTIFPLLTPLSMDLAVPFPFIPNLGHALIFELKRATDDKKTEVFVRLPEGVGRLIELPESEPGLTELVTIDEVTRHFMDLLLPGYKVEGYGNFRVIRDSDLEVEEEAEDLVLTFETALKRRRRGSVVRLEFDSRIADSLREFVLSKLETRPPFVVSINDLIPLTNLQAIVGLERSQLKYEPFSPRIPESIRKNDGDCFQAIAQHDIFLHHPYESFDVVVQFLMQAAQDPNVVAIKQTLYRTSNDSPIIAALIEAAESGKSVTALVELKARFDEEANLRWARDLERAGVQVVFGYVGWKTHSKLSLVVRREEGKYVSYVHIGTGNYHPITARLYTDLSLLTAKPKIAHEVAQVFNFITGFAEPQNLDCLAISPIALRSTILNLINSEMEQVSSGNAGHIWAKMNSLVDPEIIDAFYRASQAGVKIELVIRGICCLRPNVHGMSENITVKSIIGRFLEHSRILCFGNGAELPSNQCIVYMGSSDLMPRNLDRRIETMVRIDEPSVRDRVLREIMQENFRDTDKSWEILPNGTSRRFPAPPENESFNVQDQMMLGHEPEAANDEPDAKLAEEEAETS